MKIKFLLDSEMTESERLDFVKKLNKVKNRYDLALLLNEHHALKKYSDRDKDEKEYYIFAVDKKFFDYVNIEI